ncbi:B73 [miniopterid betaherpesvirus 1]|uniref:B73 n=1 Tax=miniopterid betaherpesvirus 1 TaxID=3070189 RepID=I3VQ66_9BETA|nr:B73 [miniopterid betaherpesvirus 1]AFK83910.1 B73 [miniopterid betaherpesvirus 1]
MSSVSVSQDAVPYEGRRQCQTGILRLGANRLSITRYIFAVTFVLGVVFVPAAGATGASTPAPPTPTAHAPGHDFYGVGCRSHAYELSIGSFASVWIMVNFITLICSFAVFLKHWCYKTFTQDTSKGY